MTSENLILLVAERVTGLNHCVSGEKILYMHTFMQYIGRIPLFLELSYIAQDVLSYLKSYWDFNFNLQCCTHYTISQATP